MLALHIHKLKQAFAVHIEYFSCNVLEVNNHRWLRLPGSSRDVCSSPAALKCSEPRLVAFEYL